MTDEQHKAFLIGISFYRGHGHYGSCLGFSVARNKDEAIGRNVSNADGSVLNIVTTELSAVNISCALVNGCFPELDEAIGYDKLREIRNSLPSEEH